MVEEKEKENSANEPLDIFDGNVYAPAEPPDIFDGDVAEEFIDGVAFPERMDYELDLPEYDGGIPKAPPTKEFYNEKIENSPEGQQTGMTRIISVGGKLVNAVSKGDYDANDLTGVGPVTSDVYRNSNPVPDGMAFWLRNLRILWHANIMGLWAGNTTIFIEVFFAVDGDVFYYYEYDGALRLNNPDNISRVDIIPVNLIVPKGSIVSMSSSIQYLATGGVNTLGIYLRTAFQGYLFKEPLDLGVGQGVTITTGIERGRALTRYRW